MLHKVFVVTHIVSKNDLELPPVATFRWKCAVNLQDSVEEENIESLVGFLYVTATLASICLSVW